MEQTDFKTLPNELAMIATRFPRSVIVPLSYVPKYHP